MSAPVDIHNPVSDDEFRRLARRSMHRKILIAAVLGALSAGMSVMAMVGQSFSLRQARALEAIEHRLEVISDRLSTGSAAPGSASTPSSTPSTGSGSGAR